jgi:hypothetical protein
VNRVAGTSEAERRARCRSSAGGGKERGESPPSMLVMKALSCSKYIQTLYAARFQYFEQLSKLGQLQIRNRIHVINSGTQINLNLP